jgi:hypothetical protein
LVDLLALGLLAWLGSVVVACLSFGTCLALVDRLAFADGIFAHPFSVHNCSVSACAVFRPQLLHATLAVIPSPNFKPAVTEYETATSFIRCLSVLS